MTEINVEVRIQLLCIDGVTVNTFLILVHAARRFMKIDPSSRQGTTLDWLPILWPGLLAVLDKNLLLGS